MSVNYEIKDEVKTISLKLSGTVSKMDYQRFVPEIEDLIRKHGKINVLMVMEDFHGWDIDALWEDLKFDFKHYKDVNRIAMVGEKIWQKGMSIVCKPFTSAEIRYFEPHEIERARMWLEGNAASPNP